MAAEMLDFTTFYEEQVAASVEPGDERWSADRFVTEAESSSRNPF
jgi:hypothetical protein